MVAESIGTVRPIRIEDEMRASYLDYAMSVIVARALPDVRDGLKPVQRRILYAMYDMGLRPNSTFKKSAAIVGEVMGKYHPHGDSPVYEAMVRLAQDFSLRYPLINGQGNFGSVDADPPAAMRYTEARLAAIAMEMLADIEKDTVDFVPNYDGSLQEPTALPARLPNLLLNGTAGIAVGMATNIPPHNLNELCDAIARLIDDPETTTEKLTEIVRGPDFPTAGIILGREGIRNAYATGSGRVVVRARTTIEESRGERYQVVVTELPFQVNKAALIEKIAELAKDRRIEGISDIRDESDRHGMRIVIEIGRGGQARQVLNALYKHTAMQSAFAIHMLALVDGQPRTVTLKQALEHYIDHRRSVIRRRSEFDLGRAREREHVLQGLLIALDKLDLVIRTIRQSRSADEAKQKLMQRPFAMSDRQAQAVLDMQLRRLAALERQKIQEEYAEVIQQINYLEDLLANPRKIDFLIKDDVLDLKKRYGDDRRTQIIEQEPESFTEEDLIPHQPTIVTLSQRGYIKRQPLDSYRSQRRGGRGITAMQTREADAIRRLLVADTHDYLLFFTDRGRVFQLRTYELPDSSRQARGIPLINLIEIDQGEAVTAVVATPHFESDCMILATKRGEVKRTPLSEFAAVRRAGIIAMNLEPGDELIAACLVHENEEVMLVTARGQTIRFKVKDMRLASRASGGVRGIHLAKDDTVAALERVHLDGQLLTVTAYGYGKRTPLGEYPTQGRGGSGIRTHTVTPKTGPVAAARLVKANEELMIISESGIVLRTPLAGIAQSGRSAQGVQIMKIGPGDAVASISLIESPDGGQPTKGSTQARRKEGAATPRPSRNGRRSRLNGDAQLGLDLSGQR